MVSIYYHLKVYLIVFSLYVLDSPTSKSTQINWKEGVQLGQNSQEANNKTGRKRRLEEMKMSFFTWFNDNVDPYTDDIAEDFKVGIVKGGSVLFIANCVNE